MLLVVAGLCAGAGRAAAAAEQKSQAWDVQCPAPTVCVAHLDQAGIQILVGRLKPDTPLRMAVRVSAAAKSGEPVALRLDDGWQAGLRVGKCTKAYCEVGVAEKATSIAVAALSRNNSGLIAYEAKGRILLVPFSLAGFADAMNRVGK